ncbi:hypothetical protein B5V89_17060 [Heyndrickxia sporothermodurans]|uniref:hypothetical protein n=1 Tax=Heyndrickxia sporothermodurans TaxID=46224 RepID=UPI000D36B716|nr:hypothetical protein [Heyndrickxia sporothermodurans]PTY76786.1 hypothetical protein B5V89_17060 [Heyndrickxia sporothermodurans]
MSTKRSIEENNNIEVKVTTLKGVRDYIQYRKDINEFNGVYLLDQEGNPITLAIVKGVDEDLNNHVKQTGRYFSYEESLKIAILTNMVDMFFYSDYKIPGVMDETPFYRIHLPTFTQQDGEFMEKFERDYFLDHFEELYAKWKDQYTI